MITQERLKELLHYCPDTGIFTCAKDWGRFRKGASAGSYDRGYVKIYLHYKNYSAHRLAFLYMTGSLPANQVDHINQVRHDNRWKNLRDVTSQANNKNASMSSRNKSGMTGVCWSKSHRKWRSSIRVNNKSKCLGVFLDLNDAIEARKEANIKYGFHENHGKPARLPKHPIHQKVS